MTGASSVCKATKDWYSSGSTVDAGWVNLSFKEKLFYEIGQKTMSKESFKVYGEIQDPVMRGLQIVKDKGWLRALKPESNGYVLGAGATLHTGPTPGFRFITNWIADKKIWVPFLTLSRDTSEKKESK